MATFFIILLTDRRNMFVMLAIGFASAFAVYWVTDPRPQLPPDYAASFPVLLMVMAGGAFFKHGVERAVAIKVRQAYASLAGSIAHEMRHPLAQLKQSLYAMQRALPAPVTGAHSRMLTTQELNRLYEHIAQSELALQRGQQVITMAQDEVHDRPLNAGDLSLLRAGEMCARAIQEFGYEDAGQRAQLSLRVECDFVFRADEAVFLFVMFNLIRNAMANPGVQVQIVVDAGHVEVRDDGPGIAPEVQARLCQPFRGRGKAQGTGLGLAYCWRAMKAFGGTIGCSSMPGRSTTFRLHLPVATVDERELNRTAMLSKARALFDGRRLLVVDDDAAVRFLTRHKVASMGAVVDECADGAQALHMLAQHRYDLIVLDLQLPVLDGYALVERIRAGQQGIDPRLCIVACSNEPALVAQIKTRRAAIDGVVAKACWQRCATRCRPPWRVRLRSRSVRWWDVPCCWRTTTPASEEP
jgi:signal transduction histidine kinase/CheY-like chemotaxis protein